MSTKTGLLVPETMRAAFVREPGGTDRIEVGELPVPQPGPTDVLVRMEASEVNHVDLLVRSGAYRTHLPLPFVIGRDLVGVVAQVGPGIDAFRAGDRVWCNSLGHHGRQGAWSEYAVVAADRLYPLPAGVDARHAVAALHGAGTAHLGLVREARLQAGETLLVEGAGGAVGSAVVQMAKAMGARVVATAAAADADWCRTCGADVVIDYRAPDRWQQIAEAASAGIDVWWDASGHNAFASALPLMASRGRVVVMAGLRGRASELSVGLFYTRDVTIHGFVISNAPTSDLAAAAVAINRMLAAGALKTRIGATYRLADARAAQEALSSGKVRGRIVLVP